MFDLSPAQQNGINRARTLATEKFAGRAAGYDESMTFPAEDFAELRAAGLLNATVPKEHGGLGLGPHRRQALMLWLITKELARVDLSLTGCWGGHVYALSMLW